MQEIEERLKNWREKRNIILFPITLKDDILQEAEEVKQALRKQDFNNYVEELADIEIFCLNAIGLLGMRYQKRAYKIEPSLAQIESYIDKIRIELPVQTYTILCTIATICNELITKEKYDFMKVLDEKIKVVESRKQDREQKKYWKRYGAANEKWKKSKLQEDINSCYVADYSKCKIKQWSM